MSARDLILEFSNIKTKEMNLKNPKIQQSQREILLSPSDNRKSSNLFES